ncbi:VENN motif pre-toxin domain-containing protein [Mannheimia massilioguelmaensis]|uniref:VENN motif pre-toxin domain-containing protein n=1 Tax=Mannheimia massilioguelmaensis TaxID=1604354 RepID=UPI000AB3B4C1|nr:VENN motif pre-toxin domain-containing protein [Mannheimia massilioguelmaensis]
MNEKGEKLYINQNGEETTKAETDGNANKAKLASGWASLQTDLNVGFGSDEDSQSSQTISGINTKNITIRDEQGKLDRTGKTAEQIKAEVKTDITTDTAESRSGKLENKFDKKKVQNELDYQVKVIQEFQSITLATINEKATAHAESKREEANQAKANGNLAKAIELEKEAEKWEIGGAYRQGVNAITSAVGLALGGSPTAGVVTGAVSPYMNTVIKEITQDNKATNILAHAVWGAIEAYTQGGNATSGAVAGASGEMVAEIISKALYNQPNPKNLTEEQKRQVLELSQAIAGVASAATSSVTGGDSLTTAKNARVGMQIAENAVENNALYVDLMPITESEKIELVAERFFGGDWHKAMLFITSYRKAEGKGIINNVVESVESVINLDQTIKDLAYAITNPNEIVDKIVLSGKELSTTLDYAMKNDPALAGEILGYIDGNLTGIPGSNIVLGGVAAKTIQKAAYLAKTSGIAVIDQVNRFKNYSVLNKVINEVDNVAISTNKGFINASKVCKSACELKPTNAAEKDLIEKIVNYGDPKGDLTEKLINDLANRSGYKPLAGGKYGSNNGFDHVLVGKDGSIVIIDSKQIRNSTIQISSKGAGGTNQLSSDWITNVINQLPKNDAVRIAIEKSDPTSIKTIVAGIDKSDRAIKLIPVKVPNSKGVK